MHTYDCILQLILLRLYGKRVLLNINRPFKKQRVMIVRSCLFPYSRIRWATARPRCNDVTAIRVNELITGHGVCQAVSVQEQLGRIRRDFYNRYLYIYIPPVASPAVYVPSDLPMSDRSQRRRSAKFYRQSMVFECRSVIITMTK